MNKIFTRVIGVALGLAMAIGVGAAIGSDKELKAAKATAEIIEFTEIDKTGSGTGYAAYDGDHTIGNYTFTSYNVMQSGGIQFKKNGGYIQNKTAFAANIDNIQITGSNALTVYVGTEVGPATTSLTPSATSPYTYTPTGSYKYLKIINSSSGAANPSKIKITLADDGAPDSVVPNKSSYDVYMNSSLSLQSCVATTGSGTLSFEASTTTYGTINTTTWVFTPTTAGGPTTITAHKGFASATFNITVKNPDVYTLVTDLSQLTEGNKVLIAASTATSTYAANYFLESWNANSVTSTEKTVTNNQISVGEEDVSPYTLGITSQGYTFKDKLDKYLIAPGTKTTGENYLRSSDTVEDNCYFKIDLSGSDFSVVATNNDKAGVMQFNSTTKRFGCFNEASQTNVKLYVLNTTPSANDKISSFGKLYLRFAEVPHNPQDGDTGACKGANGPYYTAKAALLGGWSSILSTFSTQSSNERMRYEAWASAVGDSSPYTNANPATSAGIASSVVNNNALILVVTLSLTSLVALGGFLVIRRKKEQ